MPDRGWGYQAVRVCRACYSVTSDGVLDVSGPNTEPNEVQVRKVGETVYGTVSSLASALEFPINVIKDSARLEKNYLIVRKHLLAHLLPQAGLLGARQRD